MPFTRPMKQIGYAAYLLLVVFILAELGIRIFFSLYTGPYTFFYGTRLYANFKKINPPAVETVTEHLNQRVNYTKYFPNEQKTDYDYETHEVFPVRINRDGFRGKDFTKEKGAGVVRILTLGASSTFGYANRDSTTYPAYMEQLLNENCPQDITYEVINFGIPHLTSEEILALFLAEGIELDPDIVTFYEGINDTQIRDFHDEDPFLQRIRNVSDEDANFPHKLLAGLEARFLTFRLIEYLYEQRQRMINDEYDKDYIESRSQFFLQNLKRIYEETHKRGILFIVGNQQAKSEIIEKNEIKGVTYQEEVQLVRERITHQSGGGKIVYFLMHARMMEDLKKWAEENQIPFVDIIEALDPMRHLLVSWVHLNPEANKQVASSFAKEILKHSCPTANLS